MNASKNAKPFLTFPLKTSKVTDVEFYIKEGIINAGLWNAVSPWRYADGDTYWVSSKCWVLRVCKGLSHLAPSLPSLSLTRCGAALSMPVFQRSGLGIAFTSKYWLKSGFFFLFYIKTVSCFFHVTPWAKIMVMWQFKNIAFMPCLHSTSHCGRIVQTSRFKYLVHSVASQ